jgi:hypothetical protein
VILKVKLKKFLNNRYAYIKIQAHDILAQDVHVFHAHAKKSSTRVNYNLDLLNYLFLYFRRKKYILYNEENKYNQRLYINSVHHLEIHDEQAIINCVKYFPNTTELTISYDVVNKHENGLSNSFNSIIPLKQLT